MPRRLIWDNKTGIGRGGKLAAAVAALTSTLATRIVQLRTRDPESKGIVERRNGFFETSFMPGRVFASPADFNAQLTEWLERATCPGFFLPDHRWPTAGCYRSPGVDSWVPPPGAVLSGVRALILVL